MSDVIDIFTTGGTIDKVYFDALSEFQIGPAAIPDMLRENNVHVPHRVTQLMRKDSLELDDADREIIRAGARGHRGQDDRAHRRDAAGVGARERCRVQRRLRARGGADTAARRLCRDERDDLRSRDDRKGSSRGPLSFGDEPRVIFIRL